jgi:glycosyltransferase involved in cell wall biosynthesis
MRSTVIITTYNRPDALDRVLESLVNQETLPHELVIADDGSGDKTRACIDAWRQRAPFPIHHSWQPDDGFRAAESRNRAAAKSTGDYLVFLDGDCIVFKDFITRHQTLAAPGYFVSGHRMLLNEETTTAVISAAQKPWLWSRWRWAMLRLGTGVNRILPLLRLGDGNWRVAHPDRWKKVRTCNLGLARDDFLAINGFDESFRGWGHEDADLAARLIKSGVKCKSGHFALAVVHLWHPHEDRLRAEGNLARVYAVLNGERSHISEAGIDRYLATGD